MNSLLVFTLIGLTVGFPVMKLARAMGDRQREASVTVLSNLLLWPLLLYLSYSLFNWTGFDTLSAILTLCATALLSMILLSHPLNQNRQNPARNVIPACLLICLISAKGIIALPEFIQIWSARPSDKTAASDNPGGENLTSGGSSGSIAPSYSSGNYSAPADTANAAPQPATANVKPYHFDFPKYNSASPTVRQIIDAPAGTPVSASGIGKTAVSETAPSHALPSETPEKNGNSVPASITDLSAPAIKTTPQTLEAASLEKRNLERTGTNAPRDLINSTSLEAQPLSGSVNDLSKPAGSLLDPH